MCLPTHLLQAQKPGPWCRRQSTTKCSCLAGRMMHQRDLDRGGPCRGDMTEKVGRGCPPCDLQQRRRGGSTLLKRYNAGRMVRPECWCDKLCTRLPEGAVCTDVPNMGRSEAAFFQYVYDHYSVRLRPLLRTRGRSTRCPRASPRAKAPVETCSPCSSWTLKSDNKDPAAFKR